LNTLWKFLNKNYLKKEEKNHWFFFFSLIQNYFYRFDFFLFKIFNFLSLSKIRDLIHQGYFLVNGFFLKHENFFLSNYSFLEIDKGFENVFFQWYIFSLKFYFDKLLNFSYKNYFFFKRIYYKILFFFIKKWISDESFSWFLLSFHQSYYNFVFFSWKKNELNDFYKWKGLYFLKDLSFNFDRVDSIFINLYSFLHHYFLFLKKENNDVDHFLEFYEQKNLEFLKYDQQMNQLKWSSFFQKRRSFFFLMNLFFFYSDSWFDLRNFNWFIFKNYFSLYFFFYRKKWFYYLSYKNIFLVNSFLEKKIFDEQKKSFFYFSSFFYVNLSYL
jgi:hypothetical protein